ncbi:MAG: helix-turn-helix domain-containing protein [Scytonema sp. PMC 1069.18]|nr:helix-turn-helix domain-containing protein [Scytonema sp. PMC 1069.18]MEC4884181.1 helix-turn-helix domain-containing protein [Scytonema sp. PMC 1070.18]
MATTSVYLLKVLDNPAIEISHDELRSLLGEIEAELHKSQVYRRVLTVMQKLLGSSTEQAQALFKAVGREAITLAFHHFIQHSQKNEENNQQVENNIGTDNHEEILSISDTNIDAKQEDSTDLSHCLTNVKSHQKFTTVEATSKVNSPSTFQVKKVTEDNSINKKQNRWFQKKPSKAELAQMKAQQRVDSLHQIGQQLRQIRESQGLSLNQLHVYTHVPIRQMEAVENGNWDLLPEDVYVRGFIRVMGNALGLNGTHLAASLPATEPAKVVLPTYYQPKHYSAGFNLGLGLRPVHLYVGYATLVAGSIGGLSFMSQQANADRLINTDEVKPPSSSLTHSLEKEKSPVKPGLRSHSNSVIIGSDISPPEAF